MADVATPSGAAMFDGGAQEKKKGIEKPEKPDEETYKATLKKAEKEHATLMEKFVSRAPVAFTNCQSPRFQESAQDARQPAVTHTNIFCLECNQGTSRLRKAFERFSSWKAEI
jgi:hypothetical protein